MSCKTTSPTDHVFAFGFPGILGVVPKNLEVKAVFPSLSATVIPHSQEIKFRRGDSFNIDVQIQDDSDPPYKVDISRAILKFGAKQGYGVYPGSGTRPIVGNENLQILKQSYDTSQISLIDATNGKARIYIKKPDTYEHPMVPLLWDLEVILPFEHLSNQPGTVITQSGDPVIQGTGTDFQAAGIGLGDVIHVEDKHVMVTEVTGPTTITVDYTNWSGGIGLDYNLYFGASRVVASGPWTCLGDVVL